MRKEIDRFQCVDDAGETYTVIIRQKMSYFDDMDGIRHVNEGVKDAILSDGRDLNFSNREHTVFEILDNGKSIWRS